MVAVKRGRVYGESFSKSASFHSWGAPVVLRAEVPLSPDPAGGSCPLWGNGTAAARRREFCDRYEGYGQVCACAEDPLPVSDLAPAADGILNSRVSEVPVAVIASNRPQYLYRSLRSLLSARGADPKMVTVFIDGFYQEPLAVAKLFGLRGIQHTPIGE